MKTVTLDLDYSLNGAVLYAAAQPHPHSAHLQSLLDDGIAGTVTGEEAEAGAEAEAEAEATAQTSAQNTAQTTDAE